MLFHASIPAQDTAHVAKVLAELWRGVAFPFPPVPGSHIAMAGDDRGSAIEVWPRDRENVIGKSEVATRHNPAAEGRSATHLAIATPLGREEVLAIASREGWTAMTCRRGDFFDVIEFWVENRFLIEVLTPEMREEYRCFMTPENWARMLGAGASAPPLR